MSFFKKLTKELENFGIGDKDKDEKKDESQSQAPPPPPAEGKCRVDRFQPL
jgi:hypothetical protein